MTALPLCMLFPVRSLVPGHVTVRLDMTVHEVKSNEAARAHGYRVVTYASGERGGGHGSDVVNVLMPRIVEEVRAGAKARAAAYLDEHEDAELYSLARLDADAQDEFEEFYTHSETPLLPARRDDEATWRYAKRLDSPVRRLFVAEFKRHLGPAGRP